MALAEVTGAGVTYVITEVAYMRGLRSAEIAALLLRARLSFLCEYPPYGSHDPTIAVCIVLAAGTHWKTSTTHGISVGHLFLS